MRGWSALIPPFLLTKRESGILVGEIRDVKNVKPVCAVPFSQNLDPDIPMKELESVMGTLDDLSEGFDFSFTDYYLEEMGENLKKVFVSFKGLMHPGLLPDRKTKT